MTRATRTTHRSSYSIPPRFPGDGRRALVRRVTQAGRSALTTVPGGQQILLKRIEDALLSEDYHLDSQFAIFNRAAHHQPRPAEERIPAWAALADTTRLVTGLAVAGGAITLSWLTLRHRR